MQDFAGFGGGAVVKFWGSELFNFRLKVRLVSGFGILDERDQRRKGLATLTGLAMTTSEYPCTRTYLRALIGELRYRTFTGRLSAA